MRDAGGGLGLGTSHVRGRPEDIGGGRGAGTVGPAHVARAPEPVHRSDGPERGFGTVGHGHGSGAPRSGVRRHAQLVRVDVAQGARRVRQRANVRVHRRTSAVRSRPRGQHPRQRVRGVFRNRTHRRPG